MNEKTDMIFGCYDKNADKRVNLDFLNEKNDRISDIPKKLKYKNIKIYDNLLSNDDLNKVENIMLNSSIAYPHKSISINEIKENIDINSGHNIHFTRVNTPTLTINETDKTALPNTKYVLKIFYENILPNIKIPHKEHILINRLYGNVHTHGCPGQYHLDGKSYFLKNDNLNLKYGYTVLLYLSNNWDVNYDGSTSIILNLNKKKIFHVENVHGRVVVFPSNAYHKANEVSSYSKKSGERYVLAFHLIYDYYFLKDNDLI